MRIAINGFGRIGRQVAARARAFDMQIAAYDPFLDGDLIRRENAEPMTLKAIGKRFGLTRERVRQMEQQALDKLCSVMSREFGEERKQVRKKRVARSK